MKLKSFLHLSCGLAVAFSAPALAQSAPDQANDTVGADHIEDIVVTAQRREQNLQDVPISITALGETQLTANRVFDVRDLSAIAPNLTVKMSAPGSGQPKYSMRGLLTAGAAPGSDKGISIYMDGVYMQASVGTLFQMADVDRIEVLKGPQGTLFGRNSTGGAISIVTHNPSGEFAVRQELTYGNYDQFRSKTRIDLPKVGPLSASFAYVHSQRDGDVRNLGAGTTWDYSAANRGLRTSPTRLGDENVEAFFASLRLDLSDNFNLLYKFDYSENTYTPDAQGMAFIDSPAIAGTLAIQPNPGVLTPVTNLRPKAVNNAFSTPSFTSGMGHNVTASYAISDNLRLKNIWAWRTSKLISTNQLDGLGGLGFPVGGGVYLPLTLIGANIDYYNRQWSNETQINFENDLLNITAGYIHFSYHTKANAMPNIASFVGNLIGNAIPATGYARTKIETRSDAVFGQVEVHVTPQLDLVGGYRWTHDKKSGVDNTQQNASGGSIPVKVAYSKGKPSWMVGANYRPTDDVMVYAKYATGFISGGQLAGLSYKPEIAKSWELGAKTELFDGKLRSNLAIYGVKYGNMQFETTGANVTPVVPAAVVLINAGDARARGFEWENVLVPVSGLTLTANLGYTDFKFNSISPIIGTLAYTLPLNRPKWTGNGSIQYETGEVLAGGHLVFRGDANYRSKTYLGTTTPGRNNSAAVAAVTTSNSWVVNGRIALSDFDLSGAKAEIALWGRNIFDNRQLNSVTQIALGSAGIIYPGMYERARTFGVDLSFDF
jgi:iron complex outermembrane receptor protein